MLTDRHMEARMMWAQAHMNNDGNIQYLRMKRLSIFFVTKSVDCINMEKDWSVNYQGHAKKVMACGGISLKARRHYPVLLILWMDTTILIYYKPSFCQLLKF